MTPLLLRQGLEPDAIDFWEINEAFATQVLACQQAWQDEAYCRNELGLASPWAPIPAERLNVDGGAVALGHPVGSSGARIVFHLLKVLEREGGQRGLASLCIGGGQGGAMLIERGRGGEHGDN
jgi:acetyl-CoA C-acetyltransferase